MLQKVKIGWQPDEKVHQSHVVQSFWIRIQIQKIQNPKNRQELLF